MRDEIRALEESMDSLEAEVEGTVCLSAIQAGWLVRKIQYIGRRNAADRLFIKDGRVVFIEFKRPGKTPRPGQVREIKRLKDHGAEVHAVNSIIEGLRILGIVKPRR